MKSIDQIRRETVNENKGSMADSDAIIRNIEEAIKEALVSKRLYPNMIRVIIPKEERRIFDELLKAGYDFRYKDEFFNSISGKMCSLYEIYWK